MHVACSTPPGRKSKIPTMQVGTLVKDYRSGVPGEKSAPKKGKSGKFKSMKYGVYIGT